MLFGEEVNGANVFLYYSPSYNISGYGEGGDAVNSIYMKDMLTPYGVTANVVNLNFGQFYGTVFFDMAWLSKLKIGDNVILQLLISKLLRFFACVFDCLTVPLPACSDLLRPLDCVAILVNQVRVVCIMIVAVWGYSSLGRV